jgi:hypothetical protein
MTVTCPVNDSLGICTLLDSTGAGIAVLLQYFILVLPVFLVVLVVIGGIAGLIGAIVYVIRHAVTGVKIK